MMTCTGALRRAQTCQGSNSSAGAPIRTLVARGKACRLLALCVEHRHHRRSLGASDGAAVQSEGVALQEPLYCNNRIEPDG
jgi:hypothetical protein